MISFIVCVLIVRHFSYCSLASSSRSESYENDFVRQRKIAIPETCDRCESKRMDVQCTVHSNLTTQFLSLSRTIRIPYFPLCLNSLCDISEAPSEGYLEVTSPNSWCRAICKSIDESRRLCAPKCMHVHKLELGLKCDIQASQLDRTWLRKP